MVVNHKITVARKIVFLKHVRSLHNLAPEPLWLDTRCFPPVRLGMS